jgi:hypothetical protein
MQALEQAKEHAADIQWLASLLKGDRGAGVDATIEAPAVAYGANPFFSSWMLAWARRLVIAKALAAISHELAASARRTASERSQHSALPLRNWVLRRHVTKVQLERALLAIDVFPRCALLLLVLERMSLEDAAILLDADRRLVLKGQRTGLRELTRILARMQGWTSSSTNGYVVTSEMQHA